MQWPLMFVPKRGIDPSELFDQPVTCPAHARSPRVHHFLPQSSSTTLATEPPNIASMSHHQTPGPELELESLVQSFRQLLDHELSHGLPGTLKILEQRPTAAKSVEVFRGSWEPPDKAPMLVFIKRVELSRASVKHDQVKEVRLGGLFPCPSSLTYQSPGRGSNERQLFGPCGRTLTSYPSLAARSTTNLSYSFHHGRRMEIYVNTSKTTQKPRVNRKLRW